MSTSEEQELLLQGGWDNRVREEKNLATGWLLLTAQETISLQPLPSSAVLKKTLLKQFSPPSKGQRPHNFPAPTQLFHI